MKIIDLLNKIANGEELPEKIKYENIIWILNNINDTYDNGEQCFFEDYIEKKYDITDILNEEVEVIEENKKIIPIPYNFSLDYIHCNINDTAKEEINKTINNIYYKINEIIDKVNSMEDK